MNEHIKTNYDSEHDILCVLFGDNKTAYEDEYAPGYGIIKDMFSDKIVGFSCYYYLKKQRNEEFKKLLSQYNILLSNNIIDI